MGVVGRLVNGYVARRGGKARFSTTYPSVTTTNMGIFSKPLLQRRDRRDDLPEGLWIKCPDCGAMIHTLDAPPAAPTDAVAPDVRGPGRRTADPDSLDGLIDALLFGGP